jgi:hypothetical protein
MLLQGNEKLTLEGELRKNFYLKRSLFERNPSELTFISLPILTGYRAFETKVTKSTSQSCPNLIIHGPMYLIIVSKHVVGHYSILIPCKINPERFPSKNDPHTRRLTSCQKPGPSAKQTKLEKALATPNIFSKTHPICLDYNIRAPTTQQTTIFFYPL